MSEAQALNPSIITEKLAEIHNLAKQPANELKPYIDTNTKGVFYVTRQHDKESGEVVEKRTPLSSHFTHLGGGVDDNDNHYAVLEKSQHYGKPSKTIVLPLGMVGTGQGWSILQNNGVMVYSPKLGREKLADHIQEKALNPCYAITDKGGWHHEGKAYILPSGEILTNTDNLNVIYNGDKSQAAAFKGKGTVQSWNDAIGRHLAGNSRLCLAVGTALAAPLLKLLSMESGGFHIHGDSSDGKTTAAKIALSVWAHPDDGKVSWDGTGGAFGGLAISRNDNFMMLDEIGQASKSAVGKMAYNVLNGIERARLDKDAKNRPLIKWRILVFSTGEKTLPNYIGNSGKYKWQAGQETRLPSIPANAGKGLGVFDTVHSFNNGKAFADHLNYASIEHYGTVGAAFINELLSNQEASIATARQYMDTFIATLPTMGNQAGRISDRFALVVSALRLAIDAGLLPLSHDDVVQAIRQCLDDWIARSGTSNYEDKRIIEALKDFLQVHGASDRFVLVGSRQDKDFSPKDFAGLREVRGDNPPAYYIVPVVMRDEIFSDYDEAKFCQVLKDVEWLIPAKNRNTTLKRHGGSPLRFYKVIGSVPPTEWEETE